ELLQIDLHNLVPRAKEVVNRRHETAAHLVVAPQLERESLVVRVTKGIGLHSLDLGVAERRWLLHVREVLDAIYRAHGGYGSGRRILPAQDLEMRTSDVAEFLGLHLRDAELD